MSCAFDTFDHTTLLVKLSFYGLQNDAISILKSFKKDRIICLNSRVEELQNHKPTLFCYPGLKTVQFFVYNIEILLLRAILRNKQLAELLLEMQIPEFYRILLETVQYVYDSSNILNSNHGIPLILYTFHSKLKPKLLSKMLLQ